MSRSNHAGMVAKRISGMYRCTVSHGGCGRVSIKATPPERNLLQGAVT